MFIVNQLKKSFGSKTVLNGLDLKLVPGRVIGLVGENGAGKTTLFKCLAGLEHFDGSIESNIPADRVAFLPTVPYFLPKLTGWEYLRLLCLAKDLKRTDFAKANVFNLPLAEYAANYSTGMKKKLALMGILLQDNDLFILDEPFNGVDIEGNTLIFRIIERLRERGKIIVLSSHIFASLQTICDEIHWLKEGVIDKLVLPSAYEAFNQQLQQQTEGNSLEVLLSAFKYKT